MVDAADSVAKTHTVRADHVPAAIRGAHIALFGGNVLLALILAACSSCTPWLASENAPLENIQLVLLATAACLFGLAALISRDAVRSAGILLACISVIGFVRELKFAAFSFPPALPPALQDFLARHGQAMLLGIVGAYMLFYALRRRGDMLGWLRLAWHRRTITLIIAFGLIGVSIALDMSLRRMIYAKLLEEVIELNGFALLAIAGMRHLLLGREQAD